MKSCERWKPEATLHTAGAISFEQLLIGKLAEERERARERELTLSAFCCDDMQPFSFFLARGLIFVSMVTVSLGGY